MRASTFTTLIAALGLSAAGATAAWAGELRGTIDNIDTTKNTISIGGVTVQAGQYPIANLDPTEPYVVSYDSQGGKNVLTQIQPDSSDSRHHSR
jgi:hypothetical protein